jgi:hypothetical protein
MEMKKKQHLCAFVSAHKTTHLEANDGALPLCLCFCIDPLLLSFDYKVVVCVNGEKRV